MTNALEVLSLILVGALWGCTNPLLRQGAVDAATAADNKTNNGAATTTTRSRLRFFFQQLFHVRVWLPYAVNQSGSLLYYFTLANSNLSLAVPICNALALVFSVVTSLCVLGEPLRRPFMTCLGAAMVVTGVTLCLQTPPQQDEDTDNVPKATLQQHHQDL